MLRGASSHILEEAHRSLHDALCVLSETVKEPRVLYGGGWPEMRMARAVEEAEREAAAARVVDEDEGEELCNCEFSLAYGAKILLKEVHDPERFGVATLKDGKVQKIVEKPKQPETNLAVIGIYMFDEKVFEICRTLKPSARGELEITDVNNEYIRRGNMTAEVLKGWWTDAGTFESLYRSSTMIRENGCNRMDV